MPAMPAHPRGHCPVFHSDTLKQPLKHAGNNRFPFLGAQGRTEHNVPFQVAVPGSRSGEANVGFPRAAAGKPTAANVPLSVGPEGRNSIDKSNPAGEISTAGP